MPSLNTLIRSVCLCKAPGPPFAQIHFANKDNSSYIWGENLITAHTLTLFAVMNRASHICGFWFIFLTFCMQRRRVLYNHNVTRQKKRSGLWENKPPAFSPLWWVHCFASQRLLLYCWASEVYVASDLNCKPRREVADIICDANITHRRWVDKKSEISPANWHRSLLKLILKTLL